MEVLLAKKRLQDRLAASNKLPPQRIEAGSRVMVKEGREFANFRTGDEGVVVCMDEEAGRCEIRFDGTKSEVTVALRHLCSLAASPRGKSGKLGDSTADIKGTAAKRKTSQNGSPNRSSPLAPKVPSTWQNEESGITLSPGGMAPSETATELLGDSEAALRRALQEASSALEASLQVVAGMKMEKAEVLGQKNTLIMMKEESFQQWQRAITAMQSASVHCSKVLGASSLQNPNGAMIQVPVETLGFRPLFPPSPQVGLWPPGPPLSFRAPRAFAGCVARSTSAPPLYATSAASPRGPMTFVPGSPGVGMPLSSPRELYTGGATSAPQSCLAPAFVPSLPALSEVSVSPNSYPVDASVARPAGSSGTYPATMGQSMYVPAVRAATMGQSMYVPADGRMPPAMQVPIPHGATISAPAVTVPRYAIKSPTEWQQAVAKGLSTENRRVPEHEVGGARTRSLSHPASTGKPPRTPREKNRGEHLSDWLNQELKSLHRGLLGSGKEEEENY